MRQHLRTAFFAWEFWVPPLLALLAISSIVWLLSHNQDLVRQHQIDKAALGATDRLERKIQVLADEVKQIKNK